jgi:hypothetical protein
VENSVTVNDSTTRRIEFIRIDEETRTALRDVRALIARVMPGILDEFYAHLAQTPEVAKLFPDESSMQRAKGAQLKPWDFVVNAVFDENYVRSVTAIGEAHHRLGLEPRWYIGGYSLILTRLLRAIERDGSSVWSGSSGRAKKMAMIDAITKVTLLDMDFAISVYLEAGKRANKRRSTRSHHRSRNASGTSSKPSPRRQRNSKLRPGR